MTLEVAVLEKLAKVRAGNFDAIVGTLECESLECKSGLYRLDTDAQKLELVKDVCGLANAGGGTLLLGFATEPDPDVGSDRISAARPFPSEEFDAKQYQQIVKYWTWPQLAIEVETLRDPARSTHAIAIVTVRAPQNSDGPVLATCIAVDNGKRIDRYIGYFERVRSDTRPTDARQLHAWMVAGRRYDAKLEDELAVIRTTVLELAKGAPSPPTSVLDEQDIVVRTGAAKSAAQFGIHTPTLVLQGVPLAKIDLAGLLERDSAVTKLVAGPPSLRATGFNIHATGNPKLILSKYRQSIVPGLEVLELYRDGFAVLALIGDEDGLCYAMGPRGTEHRNINPRALAELTLNFITLLFAVYRDALSEKDTFEIRLQLNANTDGKKYELPNAKAPNFGHKYAVKAQMTQTPERMAYLVLRELYGWFGLDGDRIPFTRIDESGERSIDPKKIIDVPRRA